MRRLQPAATPGPVLALWTLRVILMRPVAEIEPESVDARDKQRPSISGEALAGPTVATILARR